MARLPDKTPRYASIAQEILLGLGGVRALRALGYNPAVWHMNEGHSAFLAVERIRVLMAAQDLTFTEALEASRGNNVFTTHTSVPAGIDIFPEELLRQYFERYCEQAGIAFSDFLALGRSVPDASSGGFSMAVSAFKTSAYRNAVSKLHRTVSQKMWRDLWPQMLTEEIPIASITNGVHLPSWVTGELAAVYDQYLEPEWRDGHADPRVWRHISEIPLPELWEAHRRRKRRMISCRNRRAVSEACMSAGKFPWICFSSSAVTCGPMTPGSHTSASVASAAFCRPAALAAAHTRTSDTGRFAASASLLLSCFNRPAARATSPCRAPPSRCAGRGIA